MPDHITIWINGELTQTAANQSVSALLDSLRIAPERVAVELNRSIVRKRDWDATLVAGDSHIEVIEFVGGG